MNLWSTPIFIGNIENSETVQKSIDFLLQKLNTLKEKENLFFEENLKGLIQEIIEPAFNFWTTKFLDTNLQEFEQKNYRIWLTDFSNGYNMLNHNHSGSTLSAVFYLLNDDENSGKIVFFDPRINANRGYKGKFLKLFDPVILEAKQSSFIVFPSFLYHQVTPFYGKIRLALPVDLYL